ncbi:sugar-binding protein [Rubellimicrobium roseum]|uniref:Sugar ABC transporter substrate-binding protein n=1 Tax=Rubellimicrobium roseum TaxID=687525 RepID=A0A5C4NCZ2_9RHOB|nr:sugar-binding protein [Rubellimicrobium roseum]TNC71775.1 sugar ABC transporter substrate-binding protein [Rubellimicrobium roseum]
MQKLLAATALVALLAPAGAIAQESYTFALVPKAMNNPFFDLARDGCMAAAEELGNVTCNYIGPGEHTEMEQVQIVQDLISQGVDGIAVAPSNAPAMGRALRAAVDAGIPVMTWDSDLLPEDAAIRSTYVGTKNYDIGVELANIAKARHPDGGTICLQTGGAAAANHNERLKGIRDTLAGEDTGAPPGTPLAGQGGWTEISGCPLITDDDGNVAVQGMTDILAANPDLTAFISTGAFTQWFDNAYRQAVQPYAEELTSGELSIIVADTLPMQMAQLKDGLSVGQVGQRPYEMGHQAMSILLDIAEGKEVQDPIYTGLDICTQENVDTCLGGSATN